MIFKKIVIIYSSNNIKDKYKMLVSIISLLFVELLSAFVAFLCFALLFLILCKFTKKYFNINPMIIIYALVILFYLRRN
jgi:positive regulator of sigma E activity